MKKLSTIIVTLLLLLVPVASAQTISPMPTKKETQTSPADEKLIEQINNLKEKVASKVAELKLVEKRGLYITVTGVSGNKITGTDIAGTTRYVDVDELTKFSSSAASFGISDIKEGTNVSIIGLYNKQSKRVLARFIKTEAAPLFINGVVSSINTANYTVTVVSEDQKKMLVDIETVTKTSQYTKEDDIAKLGFSKIQTGQRAYVTGYKDKNEAGRMTATRVLIMPELPTNPNNMLEAEDEATPSAESTLPTKKIIR